MNILSLILRVQRSESLPRLGGKEPLKQLLKKQMFTSFGRSQIHGGRLPLIWLSRMLFFLDFLGCWWFVV